MNYFDPSGFCKDGIVNLTDKYIPLSLVGDIGKAIGDFFQGLWESIVGGKKPTPTPTPSQSPTPKPTPTPTPEGKGNTEPGKNTFSKQGLELLADLELPEDGIYKKYFFYDKNGKKIGIKPYLVGDGGITIGYGHYTGFDNAAGLKWLKDTYGIDKNMTQAQLDKIMVPIEDCLNILSNDIRSNATAINSFLKDNKITLQQNEFDALVINRYNKGHLTQPILDALRSGSRDRKVWENAFYAGLDPKSKFYDGWKKRRQDELEVFLDNDYTRIK